ncbi:MAG: hypothetical protein WCG19_09760 [Chlorobiaceae bacterium]
MIPDPVKVAAPAILLAPVAAPILHGLSGIAVVGLGIFAAGAIVTKTVKALTGSPKPPVNTDRSPFG